MPPNAKASTKLKRTLVERLLLAPILSISTIVSLGLLQVRHYSTISYGCLNIHLISGPGKTITRKVAAWTHSAPDRELEGVDGPAIRQRELRAAAIQSAVRQYGFSRLECLLVLH